MQSHDSRVNPEKLIDIIFEEIAAAPVQYDAVPESVLTVCASFGCGGAERQAVTTLSMLAREPRIKKVIAVARSSDLPGEDFFLPRLRKIPLEPIIYGNNRAVRSEIGSDSPLNRTPRLHAAVDALPRTVREDIVRFSNLLVRERPQIVHQRQEMYGCALASAIVGVPKIVVHRGSTAPNLWRLDEGRQMRWVRPVRHAYRRLLGLPGMRMVNITKRCSEGDREWIGWPDSSRFHVVRNGVDFQALGPASGCNWQLRRSLGIADHAFVVGGAFRLASVKRPMFWMAVAEKVAQALPDSHFVVIGDGPLKDDMLQFAGSRGFLNRLHLPGAVAEVGEWYSAMDLNLLTSEREGLGNVLVEGQHFGVPVVATDVGGVEEAILPGVTGHLVSFAESPAGYAEIVLRMWNDEAWRRAARAAGPQFVHQNFSLERALDRLLACYGLD
jgi:glycosyltransferase involved in cell wall biosynthesis